MVRVLISEIAILCVLLVLPSSPPNLVHMMTKSITINYETVTFSSSIRTAGVSNAVIDFHPLCCYRKSVPDVLCVGLHYNYNHTGHVRICHIQPSFWVLEVTTFTNLPGVALSSFP